MIKHLLLILAFVLMFPLPGQATPGQGEIFILQSSQLKPYQEALSGLRETLGTIMKTHGPKTIQSYPVKEILLSQKWSSREIKKQIAQEAPSLIIALGTNALDAVKNVKKIPIVYLMVPFPDNLIAGNKNITGVDMIIPPEKQLESIHETLPTLKTLGLVYDPKRSGTNVEKIIKHSAGLDLRIDAKPTSNPKEVPGLVSSMTGTINAYWMIPDLTVVTPQSIEHIFLFSLENRIPVITFSEKYLAKGATLAVCFDIQDMGRQAGLIAKKIIYGSNPSQIKREPARKTKTLVNMTVAKKLGLNVKTP